MPFDATPILRLWSRRRSRSLAMQDPVALQAQTLRRLIRHARHTAFGRAHNFAGIRSVAGFQTRVPLRTWEDMWRDWWGDPFPVLDNVSWPGRVRWFALTSGTAGSPSKHIPVTNAMMRSNRRAAWDVLSFHMTRRPGSRIWGGPAFLLGGSTDLTRLPGGARAGDLSGIAAATVPWPLTTMIYPPPAIALLPDWPAKLDYLTADLPDRDLRLIAGTPSWLLVLADRLLAETGADSLGALFPNLELLVHGGVSLAPYRARLHSLLAGCRAELAEVYPASEGFFAAQDSAPEDGLRLMADHGLFFEFVPVEALDRPNPPRHWLADAEVGRDYALAVSTCAGAWAYVVGDTVRLVSHQPPRLRITGRTAWSLSAFGEHLVAADGEAAVAAAANATGLDAADWCMGALVPAGPYRKSRHWLLVEFTTPPPPARLNTFAEVFDATLKAGNDDYASHRTAGVAPPRVSALPPGRFAAWMAARGKAGGQNKVPRLIADPAHFAEVARELMEEV